MNWLPLVSLLRRKLEAPPTALDTLADAAAHAWDLVTAYPSLRQVHSATHAENLWIIEERKADAEYEDDPDFRDRWVRVAGARSKAWASHPTLF